jgi:enoyl-CoA hydratase/3-hydroxyacyl-CoA dehydrogenase
MNALNETVVNQLEQRFDRAEADVSVKAIVLQGAGKAFVAGADIKYFVDKIKADRIQDIVDFTRKGHEVLLKIENSPKPTIALLDGLSMGGGSELALACQAIIATPAGSMGFPETNIGIYPGLGGMLRMTRQVGPELAKYFVFTGAPLSAEDAHALGIVTRLVPPAEVPAAIKSQAETARPEKYRQRDLPEKFSALAALFSGDNVASLLEGKAPGDAPGELTQKVTKALGFKAPMALRLADEIIDQQQGLSMTDAVEVELGRLTDIFSTADALEGLSTVGKSRPQYQGK